MRLATAGLVIAFASAALASPPPSPEPSPGASPAVAVLTPEESARTFRLAPGFRAELVAAEPLVDHPVAMDIDADGRLWVVEMTGFMRDTAATGLADPTGRIAVLEDQDGDGRMDRRTVFADRLVLPRSVKVIGRGALVGEPPHLWYCPDDDGDLKADRKVAVSSDYRLRDDNPELGPNSPLQALDNWIYHAAYSSRIRWTAGGFTREADVERGQWGLAQDDVGRLWFNTNRDQLRADLVGAHYFLRNPDSAVRSGVDLPITTDQTVWPAHPTRDVNEGGKPGILRADGTLKAFTAACGPVIYRGDNFPAEFGGNAFVCEPAGNLVKRGLLRDSGVLVQWRQAYEGEEFLASTDPRFRPVNLYNAPDGTLLVVDMYKGIILYKQFMTDYLRNRLVEQRMADPPRPLGRIWRIVHTTRPPARTAPRLSARASPDLVALLAHPSGWWRDTAQRLLVERGDAAALEPLRAMAGGQGREGRLARLHALWTLAGLDGADRDTLLAALRDPDRKLRAAAVRVAEPFLRRDPEGDVAAAVVALAGDRQREVRVQVALSLGECPGAGARSAQVSMLATAPGDIFLVDAVLSGMRGRAMDAIDALVADPGWAVRNPGRIRCLRVLAQCVARSRVAADVGRLVERIAGSAAGAAAPAGPARPGWQQLELLDGLSSVVRFGSLPPIWIAAEPQSFVRLASHPDATVRGRATEVLEMLTWPGRRAAGERPAAKAPPALSAADAARAETGRALYARECMACHQADGMGQRDRAPPLLGSTRVHGPPPALVRIVLHGVTGPIRVHDMEWTMRMPGLPYLDDAEIGAILTYVRRAWGNTAGPVGAAAVAAVRRATHARATPWTAAELARVRE
jgi:mono/diheme cytochrome c family protein